MERAHMKVDETKSNQLKFGTKTNTYKDIGVDLCKQKGGWGWSKGLQRYTVASHHDIAALNLMDGSDWKENRESL